MSEKNLAVIKENKDYLRTRLATLEEKRTALEVQMAAGFTCETFRQLNVIEYSITCTRNRIAGKFGVQRIDYGIGIGAPVPVKYKQ